MRAPSQYQSAKWAEVVQTFFNARGEMLEALDAPLPDPSPVWMRARLAARERDFKRATRAIVWVQRAAVALALAIGMAFTPGLWAVVKSALTGLDLASPLAELPRSAGSPLLVVVISMIVLGGLAFFEFSSDPLA